MFLLKKPWDFNATRIALTVLTTFRNDSRTHGASRRATLSARGSGTPRLTCAAEHGVLCASRSLRIRTCTPDPLLGDGTV